jgi:glyoxylate reductase
MAERRPKIYVTRPIPRHGLDILAAGSVAIETGSAAPEGPRSCDVEAGVISADVVLALLTESLPGDLLERATQLRGIANYAVGHDNIDIAAATRLGIPVSNTPDVLTESTADLAWALLLGAARRVAEGDRLMRRGEFRLWGAELLLGTDVSRGGDGRQRTLGIVGLGRIGAAVARRARGFDLEVIAAGSADASSDAPEGVTEIVPLPELLRRADFVSLHVPLTENTRHLIGAEELRLMKPTAVLINTARGPIVDEEALVEALRGGEIAAAGLDVYEHEPALAPGLAELSNTILLPHVGSATRGTRDAMASIAAHNALAMAAGRPAPNCINPEVYDSPEYAARAAC